jgi:predicted component of type VI protein secretion system
MLAAATRESAPLMAIGKRMPSGAIRIPLRLAETCLYLGEVRDERCLGAGLWVLKVDSPIGEAELIARTPQLTKVCSARFVVAFFRL